jgi:N-acetylglucosamine-6-phosphate deacetylase
MTAPAHALVGDVLLPEGRRRAGLVIAEGRIAGVVAEPREGDLPAAPRHVAGLLAAGFIDLQVNGAFGAEVGDDPGALATLCRELPRTGVTAFLPTAISRPADRYAPLFAVLERAAGAPGARVLGTHLEGPFLAPARAGAHDPAHLRPIDPALLRDLLGSGRVRIMTLAPELPGAPAAIELLAGAGVVASAGHTEAGAEEMARAADAGLTLGTHLFNAMSPLSHRAPGAVGALLADPRLRAGIIADGVHVHPVALRVAHRAKGEEGLALVTDAMPAAGLGDGVTSFAGRPVTVAGGAARLADGTLAGAVVTMDEAVRRAARFLGTGLDAAIRMATATPADVLGLRTVGRIVAGADADLVVLGAGGVVEETLVAGVTVHRRGAAAPPP